MVFGQNQFFAVKYAHLYDRYLSRVEHIHFQQKII
jgi:hypothetical protein